MGGVITTVATVEAIDVTNRLLTVAGPEGNMMVIKLGRDVRMTVIYSEEVATSLQKLAGRPSTRTTHHECGRDPA